MQYGELITRSFSIAWRFKYLWLLAILGGADVTAGGPGGNFGPLGNVFNGAAPPGSAGPGGTGNAGGLQDATSAAATYLQDNLGTIALVGLILLVVLVAWLLLSSVTIGALVRAAAEHDAERPFGPGLAWRTGVGTFWAILGLRLLGLVWGLLVLGAIGALVALGVVSYLSGQGATLGLVVALGLPAFVLLVLASIPVGIAFILGTRAVVLEQRGPLSALGRGFGLLRARLGRVLLVWLLQVALAFAAGLGLTFAFVPVILLVATVVIAAGVGGGVVVGALVGIPLVVLLAALGVVLAAMVGTYFSTYWTLAFRRMELEAPRPVMTPQAFYGPPPAG